MPLDADDLGKIQIMLERYMPVREYDNRHLEIVQRVTKLEDRQSETSRYIVAEFEKTRQERQAIFDRTMAALQELKEDFHTYREGQSEEGKRGSKDTLKYIITVIVGFIIGIVSTVFSHFLPK